MNVGTRLAMLFGLIVFGSMFVVMARSPHVSNSAVAAERLDNLRLPVVFADLHKLDERDVRTVVQCLPTPDQNIQSCIVRSPQGPTETRFSSQHFAPGSKVIIRTLYHPGTYAQLDLLEPAPQ